MPPSPLRRRSLDDRHPAARFPRPRGKRSTSTSGQSATSTSASSSPTIPAAPSDTRSRPRDSSATTRRTGSPTRRSGCSCSSPRSRAFASGSTRCSAARRSTSPRTAPCSTWRFAHRREAPSSSTARTWCPQVHAVLDKMSAFSRPRPQRRLDGPHRQADPQRDQHRHRRLGPGPGHGLRGAPRLQRARDDVPLRLERGRHRLRRSHARPRSGRDALHHLLEDVHDARDHDERPHRPRLGPEGAGGRPEGRRQALRRGLDQRRRRSPSSASTPPTCSSSGTGSAGATPWIRRSDSRR